jgi:hypothetical protein
MRMPDGVPSALANSAAVPKRCSGFFASAASIACSTATGASGRRLRNGGGGSRTCLANNSCGVAPVKGVEPVSISCSTQPSPYRSLRPSTAPAPICSGLM